MPVGVSDLRIVRSKVARGHDWCETRLLEVTVGAKHGCVQDVKVYSNSDDLTCVRGHFINHNWLLSTYLTIFA